MKKASPMSWTYERIKAVRKGCFPSTRVMQDMTGISARTIQHYESGGMNLNSSTSNLLLFRMMEADPEAFLALLAKANERAYPKRTMKRERRGDDAHA